MWGLVFHATYTTWLCWWISGQLCYRALDKTPIRIPHTPHNALNRRHLLLCLTLELHWEVQLLCCCWHSVHLIHWLLLLQTCLRRAGGWCRWCWWRTHQSVDLIGRRKTNSDSCLHEGKTSNSFNIFQFYNSVVSVCLHNFFRLGHNVYTHLVQRTPQRDHFCRLLH